MTGLSPFWSIESVLVTASHVFSYSSVAVIESVKAKFNVRDDFNPFDHLRLDPSAGARKRLVSLINKQIQSSALEQDVKDHMIDQTYIPSSPYNQKVYQEVMEYTVKQMFSNIEISSKALRLAA